MNNHKQTRIYNAYKVTFTVPADDFPALRDSAIDRLLDLGTLRDALSYSNMELEDMPAKIERVEVMETVEELPNCERDAYQIKVSIPAEYAESLGEYAEDGEIPACELPDLMQRSARHAVNGCAEVERVSVSEHWGAYED